MKKASFQFVLLLICLFFEQKVFAIDISGSAIGCPNGMKTYQIMPISGAINYKWTASNGAKINGLASPATLDSTGFLVQIIFPANSGNVVLKVTASLIGGGTVVSNQKTVQVQPILPTVLPPKKVCFEDVPFVWCNQTISNIGTYQCILTASTGCDSVLKQYFGLKPHLFTNIGVRYLCEGDSFPVGNQFAKNLGTNQFVLQSVEGCDSSVIVSLALLPKVKIVGANEFCGDSTILLKSNIGVNNNSFSKISQFWFNNLGDTLSLNDSILISEPGKYFFQSTRKFTFQNTFCTSTDSIDVVNCSLQATDFSHTQIHKIFPNPTKNGQFYIENASNDPFFVKIRQPDGQLLFVQKIENSLELVELPPHSTGLFFIIFENLDGQFLSAKRLILN